MIRKTMTKAFLACLLCVVSLGAGADEFLVNVEAPLTGAMARAGNAQLAGIKVAAQVFQEQNPQHTIKFEVINNESKPAKAVAAVEKLASLGVKGVIGDYGTNIAVPAAEAAEKAGLVTVTTGTTSMAVMNRGMKHFFRIDPVTGHVKAMEGLLLKGMHVKSVSLLYSNKEATSALADLLEKGLEDAGVKVMPHAYDPSTSDFKPLINKVRLRDRPEVLVIAGYENDYVGILRATHVLKPSVKAVVGAWSLATAKLADQFPDLVNNAIGTATLSFPAHFKTEAGQRFAKTFRDKNGEDPDYLNEYGYVQAMLLFKAMAQAAEKGDVNTETISAALRAHPYDTLLGEVHFDSRGENTEFENRMGQIRDGKVVTVWPPSEATGELKYPAVPWK